MKPGLQFRRIHHVAIICSDYQRTRAFYCDTLCLPIANETFRRERNSYKLDLRLADGSFLEIFSFPNPPPRPSHPEACGLRHLAFAVSDLDGMISMLSERGVEIEPVRVDEFTGKRFTFFADPDGLPIELYEHT